MTEVILFAVVGGIAVAFAGLMLISKNAVHSALSLVVTMGCLAFLFLMLNAPFLAMIQITVYAGAIMVLFIFVIMLLGAEKLDLRETKFPWLPALGLTLTMSLLFALMLPILNSQLNAAQPPLPDPRVRIVHASPDVPPVTVALNDQVVAESLAFRSATEFADVEAGDYTVTVTPQDGAPITTTLSLAGGTTQSVIAYGSADALSFAVVPDDLSTVTEARSSRIVVFNGFAPETNVSLVDFGSEFADNDTITFVNDIPYGTASEPVVVLEGTYDLTYVAGRGGSDINPGLNNVLFRSREFELERDQSQLIVVTGERLPDGSLRAVADPVSVEARPAFGGPRAVGILMFTDYVFPLQLIALLLLAAMVGAIVLTRHHVEPTKQRVNVRRRVARPLTNVISSQTGHQVVDETPQLPAETDNREPAGD